MMSGLRKAFRLCSLSVCLTILFVAAGSAETNHPAAPATNKTNRAPASPELEGDVLMARGMFSAALRSYQRETVRSAVLLNKIGLAYHHLLAFDQARKYYEQALLINPRFGQAMNNLAAVYFSDGDYGRAERMYKQALEYQPDHAITLANLGAAYLADYKYKQAMEAYQQAVALDPDVLHPDPRLSVTEGSHTRAQAIAKDYSLAKMFAASGKTSQAITYLRTALENGFHDRKKLMKDRNFAALRSTPEFQQLMAEESAGK